MENKYKDFDEFFSEMKSEPSIQIKLYNKVYGLPSELPAITMFESFRAVKLGLKEISDAKQMEIAFAMLGEENVEEWCKKGMTTTQLTELMKWVAEQHATKGQGTSGKK
jgi:hypothetical protein